MYYLCNVGYWNYIFLYFVIWLLFIPLRYTAVYVNHWNELFSRTHFLHTPILLDRVGFTNFRLVNLNFPNSELSKLFHWQHWARATMVFSIVLFFQFLRPKKQNARLKTKTVEIIIATWTDNTGAQKNYVELGRSPFCDFHIWYSHILTRTFLLFTFLLWHSLSSTYFCCTQLSFSQFSPGITQPQLSLTLHNFATHTSALAYFCLSSVFYLKL